MKRIDRSLSTITKQKISQGLQHYYASLTDAEKSAINAKRSASARAYWANIPQKGETSISMEEYLNP